MEKANSYSSLGPVAVNLWAESAQALPWQVCRSIATQRQITGTVSLHLKDLFKGGSTTALAIPTYAFLGIIFDWERNWVSKNHQRQLTTVENLGICTLASLEAAPLVNLFELFFTHKQTNKEKRSYIATARFIYQGGARAFFRGMPFTAMRDVLYGSMVYVITPYLQQKLLACIGKEHSIKTEWGALIISGIVTGGICALLSHPFDTIRSWMMQDVHRTEFPTLKSIYDKKLLGKNWKVLLSGARSRGLGIVSAMVIVSGVRYFFMS